MLSMRCTRLPPMSVIVPLGTSPLASGTGVGERCLGSNPEIAPTQPQSPVSARRCRYPAKPFDAFCPFSSHCPGADPRAWLNRNRPFAQGAFVACSTSSARGEEGVGRVWSLRDRPRPW